MNAALSLAAVAGLFLLGLLGGAGLQPVFGIALPYLAGALFLGGMVWRVLSWARVPVPFRIPTTCGQQKALSWIPSSRLDNPHTALGAAGRMALEVLFFRSLLRNTKTELRPDGRLTYGASPWLWLGALAFHGSLLAILVRHLRFFTEPVPFFVAFAQDVDGFLEAGVPVFYASSVLFLAGLAFLLARRFANPMVRYISLAGDYFPLFLLLAIGISGFWLRHLSKTDVVGIKELALGLATFSPSAPRTIHPLFFSHLFMVCVLLAYFPFGKLSHMAGVFLSPTRNLANNNRAVRHVNPWDAPVKVHTYAEYEDEWREKMKEAGIPVEKD